MIDRIEMRFRMRISESGYDIILSNTSDFRDFKHCYNIPNKENINDVLTDVLFACFKGPQVSQFMKISFTSKWPVGLLNVIVMGWNICKSKPLNMKVRGRDCAKNVAFGKEAKQSSTYASHTANLAVDWNLDSEASTLDGSFPTLRWWSVDFEGLKLIDHVDMRFRMRISKSGYNIILSNTSDFHESKHCYNIPNKKSINDVLTYISFQCSGDSLVSRFMKISFISKWPVGLLEVIVMGWDV